MQQIDVKAKQAKIGKAHSNMNILDSDHLADLLEHAMAPQSRSRWLSASEHPGVAKFRPEILEKRSLDIIKQSTRLYI